MRFWLLPTLLGLLTACAAVPPESKPIDVRQYGAKGDGRTVDTAALQSAFNRCRKTGGGVVRLPAGTYLSQPLTMYSQTTLLLEEGSVLKATDEPRDYLPPDVSWDQVLAGKAKGPFSSFLTAKNGTNIGIAGKGTIDGSGARWWQPAEEARRKVPGYTLPRPNLVRIAGCKGVKVTGVTLKNSPKFHLVPDDCDDVLIDGVTILSPPGAANTDAIDPSVSRRVTITRCLMDVGDDNIAIKSGKRMPGREFACEDITVTDCVFRHGHGMSIGSETVGGVRNVTVRRCRFEGTENGLRIKSPRGRGGRVENITYEDNTVKDVIGAVTITCYYPNVPERDAAQSVTPETPAFKGIRIVGLRGSSATSAGLIVGLPESLVQDVVLQDVQLTAAKTGLLLRNAHGVTLKDVQVTPRTGPPITVRAAEVSGL